MTHDNQHDDGWTNQITASKMKYYRYCSQNIRSLLDKTNDDINWQNKKRWTILMIICRNCNNASDVTAIKLLLDQPNIDVNKQCSKGRLQ